MTAEAGRWVVSCNEHLQHGPEFTSRTAAEEHATWLEHTAYIRCYIDCFDHKVCPALEVSRG